MKFEPALPMLNAGDRHMVEKQRTKNFDSPPTILLVEDSKLQKIRNESLLHKAGYKTLHAGDGEEALRLARAKIPDLILLDMLLPKLSGPEVLSALKHDSTTARIPVIVLSSMAQSNEAKLRRDGAAGYFEKSRLDN